MPTYAYVCTECGHNFEIVHAITDAALTTCPQCGGRLRKVFHPVGVAFKGSGFYQTDSRTAAAAAKEAAEPKPAAAKSDSSTGSDAAPAKGTGDKSASGTGSSSDASKSSGSKLSDSSKSPPPAKRGTSPRSGNNS